MTVNEMINKVKTFPVKNGDIISINWEEKMELPGMNGIHINFYQPGGFLRVEFVLHPTSKSNIQVAVGLPDESYWNGNLLGMGNGGSAGQLNEGNILSGVCRKYVTVHTNMGTSSEPYDCIGNEEVMKDFGYRSTHLMTVLAKELTEWVYERKAKYCYFAGGSTGGQQGMMEAQRYPEDYDGIICLSPAFDRIRLHATFVWNWQCIHKETEATFTKEQALEWRKCIERVYKTECGGYEWEDFLRYPGRIRKNPMDHPELQEDIKRLLTPGQARALRKMYDGPVDPVTGERFGTRFLPGTETEMLSLPDISDKEEFAHGYFFPFYWAWGKEVDFMNFDFHRDLQKAIEELSPIFDATNTDLDKFKARGGKLLVVGGSSDSIIPYTGFLEYYKKVMNRMGGLEETMNFFRFFLMPGFGHTVGGNGVQEVGMFGTSLIPQDPEHDVIATLARWVEEGTAPERLLGTKLKWAPARFDKDYDLPAFVYPNVTEYTEGDPKDHDNYKARYAPMDFV